MADRSAPRWSHRAATRALGRSVVALALTAAHVGAQQVETPEAFDSAGRVQSITPQLVERFELAPPAWPVSGDFVEARLFAVSIGGLVLSVERRDRSVDRYSLTDEDAAAIRSQVDAALARTGAVVVEAGPEEVISEPAGGAFVRNQMLLTWLVYGPLLGSLADDDQSATALYLLATGTSYFLTTALSRRARITRAQNQLATDGALRGWGTTTGLLYVLGGEGLGDQTYSTLGLVGAISGAIAGYQHGRRLTDGEAEAATTVSTLSAATALGLAGTFGFLDDDMERAAVASIVGAGVAGYVLGPRYPRTSRYAVTQGDVQMLNIGAILGAAAALTPIVEADIDASLGFGLLTAGLLGGTAIADRVWVRRYDHTTSDRNQIGLGLMAGALIGAAAVVLLEPDATGTMALVTTGAIAGTILGHSMAAPRRADAPFDPAADAEASLPGVRVRISPGALAMSAARVPGRHAVLSIVF